MSTERVPQPEAGLHQATVTTSEQAAQRISTALEESDPPPLAVGVFETGKDRFEVFAHYDAPPPRKALAQLVAEADSAAADSLRIAPIAPADWVTLSQGKRGKVRAGRFLVYGSHDKARVPRSRFGIEIDAGQAFGTAHHATTRACLLALDALLKRAQPRRVLDLGTGSGVLAIAAAKALHSIVRASDSDPIAVQTAAENARKNGVGPLVCTFRADGFGHAPIRRPQLDLVLANLLARALRELAPHFARNLAPGGRAVLSGITQDQTREIEAIYRAHGFVLESRILLDGWAVLVVRRRNLRPVHAKRRRD